MKYKIILISSAASLFCCGAASAQIADSGADEIVVTAQKKGENLLDVPVPVSTLNGQRLIETNQRRIEDFFTAVPGLSLQSSIGGTPAVIIRGISTGGFANPTVGVTIDDAPYGASTALGGGYQVADLDPDDIARIEVLRGPQGTLYGASSLGGLIKYVTIDPSFSEVTAHATAGTENIRNGDGLGYYLRGGVDGPINDSLAIRVSAFGRRDAGYIDQPALNLRGINDADAYGARITALLKSSETFYLKLSAMHQYADVNASNEIDVNPATGRSLGLIQTPYLPGSGGSTRRITFLSGVANLDLNGVDLTSVTSYGRTNVKLRFSIPGLSAAAFSNFGVTGVPYLAKQNGRKFSQELRANIRVSDNIDWLVGAFYTREKTRASEDIRAGDAVTGEVAGSLLLLQYPLVYKEIAAFTNLTYRFNEAFDIQAGIRRSRIKQSYSSTLSGPLPGGTTLTPEIRTKSNATTFLVTPRLRLSKAAMIYARVASGYRPGGPNFNSVAIGVSPSYGPDKTLNYEAGIKGELLDGALTYDASIYHIDWKDIQSNQQIGFLAFIANAGKAKSEGIELSVQAKPAAGLTISPWISLNRAQLASAAPANSQTFGAKGDRLPFSAKVSASISATQEFPVTDTLSGFAGIDLAYVGSRLGGFTATPTRVRLPAYTKANIRIGLRSENWDVVGYINNITDRRGFIAPKDNAGDQFTIIQPRTVGVSVTSRF